MESETCDPVIDEIRAIRRRISARFGHDPARLVAHDMEFQKQFADRLIDAPAPPAPGQAETPACPPGGESGPRPGR
jgi:hypothetical protein